ncbi:MAG: LacI family DNA-binding transcriptional regulator [Leifsonia sp.]
MTVDPRPRRPTIRDVARSAGVSHATVSRYLNERSYVSAEAGRAIEAAVRHTQYVPNRTARSLVSQKTFSAACIVREHSDQFFADPNLSAQAIGANATFSAHGYQMLILIVEGDESTRRAAEIVAGGAVDGALLLAMLEDDPLVLELSKAGTPLVTASTPLRDSLVPYVDTDNKGGTALITQRLLDTGRRVVAEIHGPDRHPVSRIRHEGFMTSMRTLYRPDLVAYADDWTPTAGKRAMRTLLEIEPKIDGVVAASDGLASGAASVLLAAGRSIPHDVGIVGFDDSSWATNSRPKLSTVRQDARLTGQRLAEVLIRQIEGEDLAGFSMTLPNSIVWRDSA